jgi:hypothetical protein
MLLHALSSSPERNKVVTITKLHLLLLELQTYSPAVDTVNYYCMLNSSAVIHDIITVIIIISNIYHRS